MLNFYFEPIKFVESLKYMGIGMLGIFIIVGVIMGATYATAYLTNKLAMPPKDDTDNTKSAS